MRLGDASGVTSQALHASGIICLRRYICLRHYICLRRYMPQASHASGVTCLRRHMPQAYIRLMTESTPVRVPEPPPQTTSQNDSIQFTTTRLDKAPNT